MRPENEGSRAREGPGSLGFGSPTSARDHHPGKGTVAVMIARGADRDPLADRAAAAAMAEQIAALAEVVEEVRERLDALRRKPVHHHGGWCGGEFGPGGEWREHDCGAEAVSP